MSFNHVRPVLISSDIQLQLYENGPFHQNLIAFFNGPENFFHKNFFPDLVDELLLVGLDTFQLHVVEDLDHKCRAYHFWEEFVYLATVLLEL
jgi:hypothetical protein